MLNLICEFENGLKPVPTIIVDFHVHSSAFNLVRISEGRKFESVEYKRGVRAKGRKRKKKGADARSAPFDKSDESYFFESAVSEVIAWRKKPQAQSCNLFHATT